MRTQLLHFVAQCVTQSVAGKGSCRESFMITPVYGTVARRRRFRFNPLAPGAVGLYSAGLGAMRSVYNRYRGQQTKVSGSGKRMRVPVGKHGKHVKIGEGQSVKDTKYRRRSKRPRKCTIKTLCRDIKDLKNKTDIGITTKIYMNRRFAAASCTDQQCNYRVDEGFDVDRLITSVVNDLQVYDPSAPGTYLTSDWATGTQSKHIDYKAYGTHLVRNNYCFPAKVQIYCVQPKQNSNVGVLNAITSWLQDSGVGSAQTSIMNFPSHSKTFRDLWKIVAHKSAILEPGSELELKYGHNKWYELEKSHYDESTSTYKRGWGEFYWLVRIEGVVAHDSVTANLENTARAKVDIMTTINITVRFDGGIERTYYDITNEGEGMLNEPNVISDEYMKCKGAVGGGLPL